MSAVFVLTTSSEVMGMQKHKTVILLSLVIVFLIVVCVWLKLQVSIHSIENAFVLDYVEIFYQMEDDAIEGRITPKEAADYVEWYYGAGSKLQVNTVPSRTVEKIRARVLERLDRLEQANVSGEEHETGVINGKQLDSPEG